MYLQDVAKVSVEPFLRWVHEDAEQGFSRDGFSLTEAPTLGVPLEWTKAEEPPPTPKTRPTPERCTAEEKAPMNLPDVVQAAVRTKLTTELKPVTDKLARLRATLDAYEVRAKQDAERRVSNAMLAALGEPQVAADPAYEATRKELQDALTQVGSLVGLDAPPKESPSTGPESAPAAPAPPSSGQVALVEEAPPVSAPPAPPRKLSQDDVAWAKRLITETETLKAEIKDQHPTRLFPLLQAITAEIRLVLERLPEDHFFHERLGTLIPLIGALKAEGGVEEYIRGLAFGSTGDWQRLSYKNRRKVEGYDRDVAEAERRRTPVRGEGKGKKAGPEAEKNGQQHQWPDFPRLHKLTKPILFAGGLIIPEKIKNVHERWGLDVEWHEIDHDNPRASQSLVARIRAGKIGAVVLLEGVMRHSTFKPMVEACNNMNVPFAMGDKAGIASLQAAFSELERKLAAC